MKTLPLAGLCAASFFFALSPVRAETPDEIPNPRKNARSWVADNADVLSPDDEARLNNLLSALEKQTSDEFAVVTVRNLGGQDIESFGDELARKWKIGKAGKDNGLLLLVSIGDKKSRFEVGYGLSDALNDARAGEILRNEIRPAFRQGNYAGGLIGASQAAIQILAPGLSTAPAIGTAQNRAPQNYPVPGRLPTNSVPTFPPPRFSGPFVPGGGAFLLFLLGGGALAGAMAYALTRPRKCSKCGSVCQPLDHVEESKRLKEGEVWEEHLGARDYTIWKCQKCTHEELEVKDRFFTAYHPCRRCGFKTAAAHTQTLEYPTYFSEGLERVTVRCELPSCQETWAHDRATPRLPPPVRHRRSSGFGTGFGIGVGTGIATGGWGMGGSGSNNSGGFGSNDSGPSDFGGGDFGGDGASSDW